jgi:hypothetical protein
VARITLGHGVYESHPGARCGLANVTGSGGNSAKL